MSSDKTLETLKVVIEGDAKKLKEELKNVRKELNSSSDTAKDQQAIIKKSMEEQSAAVRKVKEQMAKLKEEMKGLMNPQSAGTSGKAVSESEKGLKEAIANIKKEFQASTEGIRNQQAAIREAMEEQMSSIRKVKEQMEEITSKANAAYNTKPSTNGSQNVQREIDSTEKKLRKLIATRDEMESSGGDIEYTNDYKEIAKAIEQAEKRLNSLMAKQEKYLATGGKTNTSAWKKLQYDIEEADNSLKAMKADMANLSSADKFQNTDKYIKLSQEIERTKTELAQLNAQQSEFNNASAKTGKSSKAFDSMRKVLKSTTSEIKKTSGAFASLIQKFKTGIPLLGKTQKSMSGIGNTGKGLSGMFKTIGMTAKFMLASFLIMGSINMAKEGMQNLAKYSDIYGTKFNKNMTAMYSSLKQLQNAFATAFEPIVNVVAPYITKFVGYLTDGANALAQFFSALTGSSTWTKATYNTQNYADSLDDATSSAAALNRELYSFDEINKQSDSSSSGSGLSAGSMFDTETVSNQFADFAQLVKDAWSKANFTGIGAMVGSKLKAELDGIDWKEIKESCNNIAKSVGTFINGFISVNGLDKSIGKTIGQSINTGVGTANTFFKTVKFQKLGEFIASTANSAIQTTHFDLLGETVANGLKAGIDTWYGFVTTFNFDNLGSKIGESIKSFFETMNYKSYDGRSGQLLSGWQKLGISIGKSASGFADTIVKAFETVDWKEVREGVSDLIKSALSNLNINVGKIALVIAGFKLGTLGLGLLLAGLKNKIVKGVADSIPTISFSGGKIGAAISKLPTKLLSAVSKVFDVVFFADILRHIINNAGKALTGNKNFSIDPAFVDTTNFAKGIGNSIKDFFTGSSDSSLSGWWKSWTSSNSVDVGVNVKTDKKQAQKSVNDTTSYVSNSSKTNPIKTAVTNDSSKDALNIYGGVNKALGKYTLSTKTTTSTTGNDIFKLVQKGITGKTFHAPMKSDTSGKKIFSIGQSEFKLGIFHTKAKSDTSGDSVLKTLQKSFGANPLHTTASLLTSGVSLRNGLQNSFGSVPLSAVVTIPNGSDMFNSFYSQWEQNKRMLTAAAQVDIEVSSSKGVGSIAQSTISLLVNGRASGGIFSAGAWKPVTAYAGGGTPASAQLFMAREAGPELVGTIGNHTAVVNNDQIVASVASGVYRAVASAMMASNASNSQSSQPTLNVYVGGKQITDYVIKDVNNRTIATGKCPITT